jgi:uronate dehydrogenase
MATFQKLLLTGAGGGLGRALRQPLARLTNKLRLSDVADLGEAAAHEEIVRCDLGDFDAMLALLKGVDAVVHLGGVSTDGPFEPILNANIRGVYNLYEAARINGTKRIVFASSNHVIGFYRQDEAIDANVPLRPDGNYGVSKAFGEALSRYYFDRYGMETVCLRIGSSFEKPRDRRMLATWLSYADLDTLVERALTAPEVGHTIVYGMSNNKEVWWDNREAEHLGWKAKDSSEPYRAECEALPPLATDDPARVYQGGKFVAMGPFAPR